MRYNHKVDYVPKTARLVVIYSLCGPSVETKSLVRCVMGGTK